MSLMAKALTAWAQQRARIDAMSLRERVFLFLCGVAVLLVLGDTLLVGPLQQALKALQSAQSRQAQELQVLRAQLGSQGQDLAPDHPAARLRHELQAAQQGVQRLQAQVHSQLQTAQARQPGDAPLSTVLETLLRQHPRLQLQRMQTLPAGSPWQPGSSAGTATSTATSTATAITAPPVGAAMPLGTALRWQGVELQVSGAYPDLLNYLSQLEKALPQLRWGEMRLHGPSATPSTTTDHKLPTAPGSSLLQLQLFLASTP